MSIELYNRIKDVEKLQAEIKKLKKENKFKDKIRKALIKKKLNPLIYPSYVSDTKDEIYMVFDIESDEMLKTVLKHIKPTMVLVAEKNNEWGTTSKLKKSEAVKQNRRYSYFYIHYSTYKECRNDITFHYYTKLCGKLCHVLLKYSYTTLGHVSTYRVQVWRNHYETRSELNRGIIQQSDIEKQIKYFSTDGYNDFRIYLERSANINKLLKLSEVKTIDELFVKKDFETLIKSPKLMNLYLRHSKIFDGLKVDIYTYCGDALKQIYLNTSKGSLYIDTIALLKGDFKTIKQKHNEYHIDYYKNNKEELQKRTVDIYETNEVKTLINRLNKNNESEV